MDTIGVASSYAEWVSEANEIVEDEDAGKWRIGDLACKVKDDARYGDEAMARFASDIRRPGRTVRLYQEMSAFYPSGTRCQFPMFSRQHYRQAMQMGSLDAAMALMVEATDGNWSIRDLTDAIHERKGKPPVNRPIIEDTYTAHQGIVLVGDVLEDGKRYLVKVYATGEDE